MTAASKKFNKRFAWIALLIVCLGVGAYLIFKKRTKKETFVEVPVAKGNLAITILATATVLPENRLELKAPIAGRVEQVLVNEGDRVRRGQIVAWMSSTERAALLDAARAKGADEVKRWEELYRATPVVAPINGMMIARNVEPGQTFTNNDAILVMSDRLTVKALVDETDIGKIKLHQTADVILDAYPSDKIVAEVDQIAYEAKTVNNVTSYQIEVLPKDTPKFMRSGMTANVTFTVDSKKDILLVPSDTLKVEGSQFFVTVKNTDGQAERKNVEVGISDGKRTEILSGVDEKNILLTSAFALGDPTKAGANPFAPKFPKGGARKK